MKYNHLFYSGIKKKQLDPNVSESGFTLIEILVAMALVSIFLGGLMAMFVGFSKAYTTENVKADVQQLVRGGVEHMIPHLRMAGYDPIYQADPDDPATKPALDCQRDSCPLASGTVPLRPGIVYAVGSKVRFTTDLNKDGYIDDSENANGGPGTAVNHQERFTYQYDAANGEVERILYEGATDPRTDVIVSNVTEFKLTYLNENDAEITTLTPADQSDIDLIQAVIITMTVREPAGRAGFIERTYQNKVRCRNLIDYF